MARAEALRVEVVYCPRPGEVDRSELQLPPGSTLAQALEASGLLQRHGLAAEAVRAGVWCRAAAPETALRDLDRVELYRPLQVDPKEARRLRYRQHKERLAARAAGR
jgi:uncharacterized protein